MHLAKYFGSENPQAYAISATGLEVSFSGLVDFEPEEMSHIAGILQRQDGPVNEQALRDWASDPDSAYVAIAPSDDELEDLFADLAKNITKPGATDIVCFVCRPEGAEGDCRVGSKGAFPQ